VVLSLNDARARVIAETANLRPAPTVEKVELVVARGRTLAEDIHADRDQPAFHRATRDGYAVRAADLPGPLTVARSIAAGEAPGAALGATECVEIMTGAPLPAGADCVLMFEHARREGDRVTAERTLSAGENYVPAGSELAEGDVAVAAGTRIRLPILPLLASLGAARVPVIRRPRVAIIATGDELVPVDDEPGPYQIRDSNTPMLTDQVRRLHAVPVPLAPARDDESKLRLLIEKGIAEGDLLLLSGGVSMGKHDLVEKVLASLGARFYFDAVAIRPGRPCVFGQVAGKPFIGLPGNPVSSLVCCELFARPAIEVLAGSAPGPLPTVAARLGEDLVQKPVELVVFAPVRLEASTAFPLRNQGSGDLAAIARAGGFAVVPPRTERIPAGQIVDLLLPW
jgi:molybdopterin molybdotransferase